MRLGYLILFGKMKTTLIAYFTVIGLGLLSLANGQGKRSIDARITGWSVHISYSDIDSLPSGSNPVTKVQLSHPSINLRANMEVPFESFFALWEHLDSTSDAATTQTPVDLPAAKDGAVLKEEGDSRKEYKTVSSDKAALLIRFWLDTFKHRWVDDPSALTKEQSKLRGSFGYLLRHNPFPEQGNSLAELTEKLKAEQGGAEQPATRPETKAKGSDKPQTEAEGRSR